MAGKVKYETRTRTSGGSGPRYIVDEFVGWFARWQAIRHAKRLVKRGEAEIATVLKVTKIRDIGR